MRNKNLLDPVLLRVELVEEVFVNGLRFGRVQHVKGDPVGGW